MQRKEGNPSGKSVLFAGGDERVLVHPHYEISHVICTDASGTLHRGMSLLDGRAVAVKRFSLEVQPVPARTEWEFRLSDRIVTVSDIFTDPTGASMAVMELPDGACLERVLKKKGRFSVGTAVNIALNLSLIVRTLHVNGVGHGHINPQNVFLKRKQKDRIGIHLLYHPLEGSISAFNLINYLSPEQAVEGAGVKPSDDNWAIAVMLYHMLLGRPPFLGHNRDETIGRILTEELALHETFERNYVQIAALLYRGLAKDAKERFRSSRELIRMLKSIRDEVRDGTETQTITKSFILAERTKVSSTVPASSDPVSPIAPLSDAPLHQPPLAASEREMPRALYITSEHKAVRGEPSRRSTLPSPPAETAMVISLVDDLDTTLPSFSTELIAKREQKYVKRTRRWTALVSRLAAALLIAAVSVFAYRAYVKSEQDAKRANADAAVMLAEPPVAAVSESLGVDGNISAAAKEEGGRQNDMVQIAFEHLPENARVEVNRAPVLLPLQLQRSEDAVLLEAFVGERRIYSSSVTPVADQTIAVTFEAVEATDATRVEKRRNRPVVRKREGAADANVLSKKTKGRLSSNPYNLRKNPFATGE